MHLPVPRSYSFEFRSHLRGKTAHIVFPNSLNWRAGTQKLDDPWVRRLASISSFEELEDFQIMDEPSMEAVEMQRTVHYKAANSIGGLPSCQESSLYTPHLRRLSWQSNQCCICLSTHHTERTHSLSRTNTTVSPERCTDI